MEIKTLNLSLNPQLAKSLDVQAKKELISRSELLRKAASLYLRSQQNWEEIYRYGR